MTKYASRKARKAATRAELKGAALRRFAAFGVAATSIAAITKAAGVAHGTFYVHFSSKDELVAEFARDFNEGLLKVSRSLVARSEWALPTLLDHLSDVYFSYWSVRRQYVPLYLHHYASGVTLAAPGSEAVASSHNWLVESLALAARELGGSQTELSVVRHALFEMWLRTGLQMLWSRASERESARRALVMMTHGALEAVLPGVSALSAAQIRALVPATVPAASSR